MAKKKRSTKNVSVGKFWKKARKKAKQSGGGDYIPVDDATYLMQLVSASVGLYGKETKLMLKFCVLDEEDYGKVCTDFFGITSEKAFQFVVYMLQRFGVDLDELEIEDSKELEKVFTALVEEYACARVAVVTTPGDQGDFRNLRVKKLVEMDEEDCVEPDDALKGNLIDTDSNADETEDAPEEEEPGEGEEEAGEDELSIGDSVQWTSRGKTFLGTIEEFEDEETAKIRRLDNNKLVKVKVDTLEDAPEDEDAPVESEETPEEAPEEAPPARRAKKKKKSKKKKSASSDDPFTVGAKVSVMYGDDPWAGEITSTPPGGAKVQVTFDDGDIEMIEKDDIIFPDAADDGGDGEEGFEGKKGDRVIVQIDGEDTAGIVHEVKGSKVIVKVRGKKKPITVGANELFFDTDD